MDMTHLEQAIKDAKEGGYDLRVIDNYAGGSARTAQLLLDPAFWQALGKARGWETTYKTTAGKMRTIGETDYLEHWHCLIDHLAEGKDVESYFAVLKGENIT